MNKNTSRRSNRIKHYAEPNVANVLPIYTNSEQDYIAQSFSANNWRSISSLPTEIKTNNVNDQRASHADSNITSAIVHAPYGSYKQVGKGSKPNFEYFEYIPSEYGLPEVLKSEELKASKEKREEVNKKDWAYNAAKPKDSMKEIQSAHEHEKQYHDPYEDAHSETLTAKWIRDAKILHGPFVPSQRDDSLKVISHRGVIPDIMRVLAREIDQDWEDAEFQIYRDEEDLVIIEFNLASVDSHHGLQAYMNILCNQNPVVSEHGLSKIVELWNHQPDDGSVYYALKGPWIARSTEEVYYTLHPERRNFRSLQEHKAQTDKAKQMEDKGEK